MTLRCQDVLNRLVEAATGSLPPQERAGIADHLAACERCREEAAAIEGTVASLQEAGRFTVPPGFWGEFTDRLHERMAAERLPVPIRLRRWLTSPRHALGTITLTAAVAMALSVAIRMTPPSGGSDPTVREARGLVTDTMTTTLPSLGEMLETWRAGLSSEADVTDRAPR